MFENILGQEQVISLLRKDIQTGKLPRALLFYGSPYVGKSSTALELARVLTCECEGLWQCSCLSCRQQKILESPTTLLLGSRYFTKEISACADLILRSSKKNALYSFIRSIRKLLARFDPIFHNPNPKTQGLIASMVEALALFFPFPELPLSENLRKKSQKMVELAAEMERNLPFDGISVDQIRKISWWVHFTEEKKRVIILENADSMGESARNSFLKILEEPPGDVYFVLLTTKKRVILPTLLSRLRPYEFQTRNEAANARVLRSIYEKEGDSLEFFFAGSRETRQSDVSAAEKFFEFSLNSEKPFDAVFEKNFLKDEHFESFLSDLKQILALRFRSLSSHSQMLYFLKACYDFIDSAQHQKKRLGLSSMTLLESLFYKIRHRERVS